MWKTNGGMLKALTPRNSRSRGSLRRKRTRYDIIPFKRAELRDGRRARYLCCQRPPPRNSRRGIGVSPPRTSSPHSGKRTRHIGWNPTFGFKRNPRRSAGEWAGHLTTPYRYLHHFWRAFSTSKKPFFKGFERTCEGKRAIDFQRLQLSDVFNHHRARQPGCPPHPPLNL